MEVDTRERKGSAVIAVTGKIAGTDIIDLCKKIETYRNRELDAVVVDLSKVTFIDSHGLGGLVYSHILLEKDKKKLVIAAPQGHARSLFRDCALEKVLKVVESSDE